jgi:uncharacterized protein
LTGPAGLHPFRQFVLKVASRCDLACDHCYVYEQADQSWRGRPPLIAPQTVARAAERIAEHASTHGLAAVRVILHGGEPLLAGPARIAAICTELRRTIEPYCLLELRIHTNGVRLDADLCEVLLAGQVKVGISLDGDQAANDLHRRYGNGRSSYQQVLRAVGLLRQDRYRDLYAGLLATIDIRSDPVAAYRALAALQPPNLDFLLPHGTWDTPPPGAGAAGSTRYAEWLLCVFDAWQADGRRVPVRIFDSIIATSRGGVSTTESLGLAPSDVVIVETDGGIEQADSLKVAYDGAPGTGLDIFRHPLDEAASHPAIRARQQGIAGLCATCRACPVVGSCGGGLYAHRYRAGNGFDNPSVYCSDLKRLVTVVRTRTQPPGLITGTGRGTASGHHPLARQPPVLQMDGSLFDDLAGGTGAAQSVAHLVRAQASVGRGLLRRLRARAAPGPDREFLAAWAELVRLEKEYPVEAGRVLAHPYVRAWAVTCLQDSTGTGLGRHAGHLAAVTAAVAVRSAAALTVPVPATAGGHVYLPTLGRLRVGAAATAEIAAGGSRWQARTAAGHWDLPGPGLAGRLPDPGADWQPVRELRAGPLTVTLEDTDPYRDSHQWPAASRLDPAEASRWQEQFALAWRLIESDYPDYMAGLATGLTTITPLAGSSASREVSATARHAFGAVGIARPRDPATLALLLIHEFQHVKLGAVLDLFQLCDPADRQRFSVPWRADRRPAEAVLQGAYAHLGVTGYWRVRRLRTTGAAAAAAGEQFARWRLHTSAAIDLLARSGALTDLGMRFAVGMRATIAPWLDEPVTAGTAPQAPGDTAPQAPGDTAPQAPGVTAPNA